MNRSGYAIVVDPPGGDGYGTVTWGDALVRVYFDPLRFAAPWPLPAVDDGVTVQTAELQGDPPKAVWLIRQGTPTYSP